MKPTLKLVFTLVMIIVLAGMVLACGGTPVTESPTPTPTPTPTQTPTPTPTPTPTQTSTPTPVQTYSYSADIFGEKVDIPTDSRGAMLAAFERTSPDGVITIKLDAGTKITDENYVPIKNLSIKINSELEQPVDGSKIIGPTVLFLPYMAKINPPMTYKFNYTGFETQIAEVANAELKLGFLLSIGSWASFADFQLDTTNKIATVTIGEFTVSLYTVALLAEPPKVIVKATEGPKNGVDIIIESMPEFVPGGTVSLTIKTVPNARVIIWMINPNTGTRSAYPGDRIKDADAEGKVTFEWTLSSRTNSGEGHIEIYVTNSTDPDFLKVFNMYATAGATSLETYFPDKATDLKNFKNGLIELLELDDHTTAKMFPITIK